MENIAQKTPLETFEPPLDPGIEQAVLILRDAGVETFESCEGGAGHAFLEPTVRFYGQHAEGYRALGVALQHGLPVSELRRYWTILDGEPVGPNWEMTFYKKVPRPTPHPPADRTGDGYTILPGGGIELKPADGATKNAGRA